MRKTILILAALTAPGIAVAQSQARQITLQEAVDLARKNAPGMISARGTIRTSSAALKQAKWALYPSNISLSYGSSTSGGGTYVNDVLVTRANQGYNFSQGISGLSVTLFDGGTKFNTIRQREAQVDQAEVGEVTQTFTTSLQVKQQYYAILQARDQERAAQLQLAQAKQQLANSVARVRAGNAVHSDSLQSQLAVGTAQLAILSAQNSVNSASAQLTRLTGSDFPVTAALADLPDPAPLAISDAELFTFAEVGPAVRNQMATVAVARASERSSKSAYWPTVSLSGSYGRNNSDKQYDFGAGRMNYSWSTSLGASYQIWSGFGRENTALAAKVQVDNADANLREQKLLARQNLTTQLGALRVGEEQVRIQQQQVVIATINLDVVSKRYELGASGAGTLLDVITAQNSLNTARTALANARFTVRTARAQIESLIGRDLPQ